MQHFPWAEDSGPHMLCSTEKKKKNHLQEKKHISTSNFYIQFTDTWDDNQEELREKTLASFFFQVYLLRALAANPGAKRVHRF